MPGPRRRYRGGTRRAAPRQVRGFMEPCLLLLLHIKPRHGYELARALSEFGMDRTDASLVYRMLRDMERAGLIESQWQTEVSFGPARRIYRLTRPGNAALGDWVAQLHETDQVLHHFLALYDRHMQQGDGDFHTKGSRGP